jgi:hypothetical protein
MATTRVSREDVARRGEEIYSQSIRSKVETEENVGKLVSIDIETGDYEIGTDQDLDAPRKLRARNPTARIYTARIGFNAVYAIGGIVERRTP